MQSHTAQLERVLGGGCCVNQAEVMASLCPRPRARVSQFRNKSHFLHILPPNSFIESFVNCPELASKYCLILHRPGAAHINPSLNRKIRCNLLYWGYLLYSWGSNLSFSVRFYNLAQSVHITRGSGWGWARVSNVPSIPPSPSLWFSISQLVACTVLVLRWSLPASGASSSLSSKSFSHHDFLPDLCLCWVRH